MDLSLYSDSVRWNSRLLDDRDVKRSTSFSYAIFLLYFRLMVGREVDGPMMAVLDRSWAALGAFVGGLGPLLGPMLAVLGHLGRKSVPGSSGQAFGEGSWPEKWQS